jgi:hypothetical protein
MRQWSPGGGVDDGHGVETAVSLPIAGNASSLDQIRVVSVGFVAAR